MLKIRAEDNVLARALRHMLGKYGVQSLCLFQCATQGIKIPFGFIPNRFVLGIANPLFILFQFLLVGVNRNHILRSRKNAADNRIPERHLGGDIAVEQLIRHVALIVKITDIGCRQSENWNISVQIQKRSYTLAPFLRAATVKFIKDNVVGMNVGKLFLGKVHESCVSIKPDILRLPAVRHLGEVFKLSSEDIFGR